jgi:DNA-binding NarL/FixJ family response regulator
MDLEMPGMGGTETTRQITDQHPNTRIVVLTSHAAAEDVFPALKAGALGYQLKHSACRSCIGRRSPNSPPRRTPCPNASWRCCACWPGA